MNVDSWDVFKKKMVQITLGLCLLVVSSYSSALQITSFTGDTVTMEINLSDTSEGVQIDFSFVSGSLTGDITGVWLGIDDTKFDPSGIQESDIEVMTDGFDYEVLFGEGGDLYTQYANLNGEKGYALSFDLDFAVIQESSNTNVFDFLTIVITTDGLMASHFDAFGARVQSIVGGTEGSAKLAGTAAAVPIPASLVLFGSALFLLGCMQFRARIKPTAEEKLHVHYA